MDSPNGDHRLANAISFLINRINSAMLNHNDSNKNSWCDNQSAPKTFITIIFISVREDNGGEWGYIREGSHPPCNHTWISCRYWIAVKHGVKKERSFGFILDTSFDAGPSSEGVSVVRGNKHPAFFENVSEWETRLKSKLADLQRFIFQSAVAALQPGDLISSWKTLAENSCLLTIKHVRVYT